MQATMDVIGQEEVITSQEHRATEHSPREG